MIGSGRNPHIEIRNLADQLVHVLRERILSGDIAPGQALRQDLLAAQLGVSKIPLREAFGRLEQEGLISSKANHGWCVRPLNATEAQEIFALRLKLEPVTAADASGKASSNERYAAMDALAMLDVAIDRNDAKAGELNRAFHLSLIQPSGQPITTSILERLHILSERYVRAHLEPKGRDERAHGEHKALLEAWLKCDAKLVRKLSERHISQTAEDLCQELAEK